MSIDRSSRTVRLPDHHWNYLEEDLEFCGTVSARLEQVVEGEILRRNRQLTLLELADKLKWEESMLEQHRHEPDPTDR